MQPLILSITSLIISLCISIAFPLVALFWIDKLEKTKCECSDNWERQYMKGYLYFIISFVAINILLTIILRMNIYTIINNIFGKIVLFVVIYLLIFAGLSYTVITIDYITKLKNIDCKCSEDMKREVTYIFQIVIASLYALIFFSFIISALFGGVLFNLLKLKLNNKNN